MKRLLLLFGLVLIIQAITFAQPCLPEGIIFTTQTQIDSFQIIYPNCTEIEGDVRITGDDISNVNGLNVLTSIGGRLQIGYEPIPDYVNPNLTTLTGLANLTSIGGDLIVLGNAVLSSLSGLDNVTSIGGNLLGLAGNQSLISISSLENVTSFEGILNIESNPVLTNLTGLDNLTAVEDLYIGFNDALTDITAFSNITTIGGNLDIDGNGALTSLSGLNNIEASSIDNLVIEDNSSLAICEVQSVCDYLANPSGTIKIEDNASGCNNQAEVEEACLVGISILNFESEFSIYPNPATNKIFIVSINGLSIEEINIYNQLGQIALNRNEIRENINISILEQGIYIVEVTSGELKIRQKLVIEK